MSPSLRIDASGSLPPGGASLPEVGQSGTIRLGVRVVGKDVEAGSLELRWDESLAVILSGDRRVPLAAGTYDRELEWLLIPQVKTGTVEFDVLAFAGGLIQRALVPVELEPRSGRQTESTDER